MREIVTEYDPIGIYFGKNTNFDEYDPEIEDIFAEFKQCKSLEEFTAKVYRVFQKWFGSRIAGSKEKYTAISKDFYEFLASTK